jgi:hypothetical protein
MYVRSLNANTKAYRKTITEFATFVTSIKPLLSEVR